MNNPKDTQNTPEGTNLILPVICPHCSEEIHVEITFALLNPDVKIPQTFHEPKET